jgi:choloylglycine hydrolase
MKTQRHPKTRITTKIQVAVFSALFLWASTFGAAYACTGIKVKSEDGAVIFARTAEFGVDLDIRPIGIPAGTKFVGSAPGNKPGLAWTSKYAAIGTNTLGMPYITTGGLNEKGLYVGAFNLAEFAVYQDVTPADYDKTLNCFELSNYLLTTTATVDEAIAALREIKLADMPTKELNNAHMQLHYRIADKSGRSVVIEYLEGELHVIENPLGAITNSPNFTWHLTNLTNYLNLSPYGWPAIELENLTLKPSSLGSGLNGLPGDFTSPSRFIRAVAFQEMHAPSATADDGIKTAFHILNQFDIPKGASVQKAGGVEYPDITQVTAASDLTNLRFFFRTYENSQIRMITMADFLAGNHSEPVLFDRGGEEVFVNITNTPKPVK